MPENFNNLTSKTSLFNVLTSLKNNINYNLNCIKVATVESFNPENLTVSCVINNKRLMGLNADGNQQLKDYPLIYAKVHYIGWGDVGLTYPITKGMEGFLLFNDREIETWFLTGKGGNLAYNRCHDLSDAIFICGLHSKPNMIEIAEACVNLFYKNSYLKLADTQIDMSTSGSSIKILDLEETSEIDVTTNVLNVNGDILQAGNNTTVGTLTADGLIDTTAYSGTFTTGDNRIVTVENGIIKSVS